MTVQVWRIARETQEWVGPITITAEVDDVPIAIDPSVIQFAVIPKGTRPTNTDWLNPVVETGGTRIGVQAVPVASSARMGIWAKFTDGANHIVLEPTEVGELIRT